MSVAFGPTVPPPYDSCPSNDDGEKYDPIEGQLGQDDNGAPDNVWQSAGDNKECFNARSLNRWVNINPIHPITRARLSPVERAEIRQLAENPPPLQAPTAQEAAAAAPAPPQQQQRTNGFFSLFNGLLGGQQNQQQPAHNASIIAAVEANNEAVVRQLVARRVNVQEDDDLALRIAATNGNLPIVELLVRGGANVNALDGSPMIRAASMNNIQVVQFLLNQRASARAQNSLAYSIAEFQGFQEIETMLLNAGAEPLNLE